MRPRPGSRWRKRPPPRPSAARRRACPAGPLHRRRRRILAAAAARRAAARGHARHLPVLARDRRAALLWSNTEIAGESLEYTGTPTELLIGFLIAIAMLVPINLVFFVAGAEHGRGRRTRQHARLSAAVRARPVRGLSRPALSPDPHGAARRALPSDRLGAPLCVLRDVLVGADRAHARPRLSVHAGEPRTLQDAPHLLRRSRRPLRGLGLAAVRCAAVPMWLLVMVPLLVGIFGVARQPSTARQSAKRCGGSQQRDDELHRLVEAAFAGRDRVRRPSASAQHRCLPSCCSRCSRRWCCAGGSPASGSAP